MESPTQRACAQDVAHAVQPGQVGGVFWFHFGGGQAAGGVGAFFALAGGVGQPRYQQLQGFFGVAQQW
ncbi:hypothetical protein JOS77_02790 [Chromobacterium haemolyticum]|nr:hypothetical protein JOS77_02790 [Chromobacterium haemolyticum]